MHTPGPWDWYNAKEDEWDVEAGSLRSDTTKDLVIQLKDDYPGYPECGEDLIMIMSKEDASLIKSAPLLLEALKEMVEKCNLFPNADYIQRARAAIAAATGGE